jgi:hypothetical protein
MVRRLVCGTLAAAALAGSIGLGVATPAQAQVSNCDSWNRGGACVETYFNMTPDPLDLAQAQAVAAAIVTTATQATSQAASQTQAQPAGEE